MIARILLATVLPVLVLSDNGFCQDPVSAATPQFKSLFNGDDLDGWKGDVRFWRVEDGAIIGQTSKDNPAPHNTFLIYEGGEFGDFVLTFKYKVDGFNSGMQYRSVEQDDLKVTGLQADFEAQWHDGDVDKFTGMFFEEGGRMFMGQRGDVVIAKTSEKGTNQPNVEKIGSVGDQMELADVIKRDDWNEYTIVANGFAFTHIVNGRVLSIGFDEDVNNRRESGILAIQLHSGTPMKIQVKDIQIREL